MKKNLTVSTDFDALNNVIADAKAWPERRKQLEAMLVKEPKSVLLTELMPLLWRKSKDQLVELIVDDLTTPEAQSMWRSYFGESE